MGEQGDRPLGVFLVHPLHTVRASLGLLIDGEPGLRTLGQFESCEEALAGLRGLTRRSEVVVMVALSEAPEHNPCRAIRTIREEFPSIPVLTCGRAVDELLISEALFFGADGFVDYACPPPEFLSSIRKIAAGEFVMEGLRVEGIGTVAMGIEHQRAIDELLTEREAEVLAAASEGLTARQIGRRLGVEERTVSTHLGRIYRKLGANGRVAALRAADRYGLIGSARS